MGLSDIDEDEPPVSATSNETGTGARPGPVSLDDLFGPSPVSQPPPAQATTTMTPVFMTYPPSATAPSELDALFMVAPRAEVEPHDMIYVDQSSDNLLDFSRPAQSTQYQNLESCLDAFEQRKKGGNARIGNASTSLDHLTRNRDDNKVKARLLPLLNCYDVLGVSRDATMDTIKRRYKQLALSLHPDKQVAQSMEEKELFKAITKAHEILCDDTERAKYDEELARGTATPLA